MAGLVIAAAKEEVRCKLMEIFQMNMTSQSLVPVLVSVRTTTLA